MTQPETQSAGAAPHRRGKRRPRPRRGPRPDRHRPLLSRRSERGDQAGIAEPLPEVLPGARHQRLPPALAGVVVITRVFSAAPDGPWAAVARALFTVSAAAGAIATMIVGSLPDVAHAGGGDTRPQARLHRGVRRARPRQRRSVRSLLTKVPGRFQNALSEVGQRLFAVVAPRQLIGHLRAVRRGPTGGERTQPQVAWRAERDDPHPTAETATGRWLIERCAHRRTLRRPGQRRITCHRPAVRRQGVGSTRRLGSVPGVVRCGVVVVRPSTGDRRHIHSRVRRNRQLRR